MSYLRRPAPKAKTLRPIPPNAGIEAAYAAELERMIDLMTRSYYFWLTAEYKKRPPEIAQDARSNFDMFTEKLKDVFNNWVEKFNKEAERVAERFTKKAFAYTNESFNRSLRELGLKVDLQWTPAMRQAFDVALKTNVALIKSIPVQFHQRVELAVARSFEKGIDVGGLQKELEKLYPNGRAKLIARDQSFKANAIVTRTRAMDLGITEALWKHSPSSKEPRLDHKAAHNKRYKLSEGCLISGEYIHPGELINCGCISRIILPEVLPNAATTTNRPG